MYRVVAFVFVFLSDLECVRGRGTARKQSAGLLCAARVAWLLAVSFRQEKERLDRHGGVRDAVEYSIIDDGALRAVLVGKERDMVGPSSRRGGGQIRKHGQTRFR